MKTMRPYQMMVSLVCLGLLTLAACAAPGGRLNEGPIPTRPDVSKGTPTLQAEKLSEVLERDTPDLDLATELPETSEPEPFLGGSSDERIIAVTNCCGLTPELFQTNYLPETQIWGDGRVIWTEQGENGSRKVFEGRMEAEALSNLVQRVTKAGFFGWEELYTSPTSPSDLPTRCIFLQNGSDSRQVCEYFEGAPDAFHQLYEELVSGLDLEGKLFQPEKGLISAAPIPAPESGNTTITISSWDADQLGLSLSEAGQGKWIEGPALEKAWEIVNANPWGGIVQDGETYYQIGLQIPGVSFIEPAQQP